MTVAICRWWRRVHGLFSWNIWSHATSPFEPQFQRSAAVSIGCTASDGTWRVGDLEQSFTGVATRWTYVAAAAQRSVHLSELIKLRVFVYFASLLVLIYCRFSSRCCLPRNDNCSPLDVTTVNTFSSLLSIIVSSSSSSTTVGSMPVGVWRHSYYRCPPLPI